MTTLLQQQEQLFARLSELKIETKLYRHPPLFTVEDSRKYRGEIPGAHCKNLFLKDKKGALWLIVLLEDAEIDLKTLPKKIGSARLSFGKGELLLEILGVAPGSVTPFALINDVDHKINVVLDSDMMTSDLLNYHPLSNDANSSISPDNLIRFIESCGHKSHILKVSQ